VTSFESIYLHLFPKKGLRKIERSCKVSITMDTQTIEVLRAESARHKGLAGKIDELIEYWAKENSHGTNGAVEQVPQPPPRRQDDLAGLTQADACHRVLIENGGALKRNELVTRANARGANIASVANLSTVLSRDERFRSVSRGYWEVVEPPGTQ
jgi:hypothetical protein